MPATVARNRWGQIFPNAEHAATKVEVVHYNRPLTSKQHVSKGYNAAAQTEKQQSPLCQPLPCHLLLKARLHTQGVNCHHHTLIAPVRSSGVIPRLLLLGNTSSWSSGQWLVSHLGRLVMTNVLFMNKALTWCFSFPEGQQHGNHTSSVIQ